MRTNSRRRSADRCRSRRGRSADPGQSPPSRSLSGGDVLLRTGRAARRSAPPGSTRENPDTLLRPRRREGEAVRIFACRAWTTRLSRSRTARQPDGRARLPSRPASSTTRACERDRHASERLRDPRPEAPRTVAAASRQRSARARRPGGCPWDGAAALAPRRLQAAGPRASRRGDDHAIARSANAHFIAATSKSLIE